MTPRRMKRLRKRALKVFVKAIHPDAKIISLSEIEEKQPELATSFKEILLLDGLSENQVVFYEGPNGTSVMLPGELTGKTPECPGDITGDNTPEIPGKPFIFNTPGIPRGQ